MSFYYSPTTKGFYSTELDYAFLPNDIIEISKEEHLHLLNGLNSENKVIEVVDGNLTLQDKVITYTWGEIRSTRNKYLQKSDYTQLQDWTGDREAWATYRQALRDITETYSDPNQVVWPTPPGA